MFVEFQCARDAMAVASLELKKANKASDAAIRAVNERRDAYIASVRRFDEVVKRFVDGSKEATP